eukprot:CAMPEP_0198432854 /NCGR_PEP_ID=MMETSP1452-20131203/24385_1 /TAXON_ID=1181717 /ORGANISM="Synchroma pusillum, Strain CCMP3072" /LENGTH=178 /DNA_ID=CAMNT_0044153339 /DNA_START=56 /DNA_END=589 /DNA_ORIENTATION=+
MAYRLRKINFLGRQHVVICQAENGPCPLIALSNVLLLTKRLEIHSDLSFISMPELITLVANRLFESNPPLADEALQLNQQQQLDAVVNMLPRLQYGLDVNLKFTDVDAFEFTEELAAFDLLDVHLYHGWLVDPQEEAASVVGGLSYNQLVERAIATSGTPGATAAAASAPSPGAAPDA